MALASNIVTMMFAHFLEDKMETIKVEIAKKLLELRIKIQLGMEVDIPMELDKLALEILNIDLKPKFICHIINIGFIKSR